MGYEKANRGLGFVLLVYATSRLLYLVAGALLARVVPVGDFQRITRDVPSGTMNLWSHWDGEHYVALAASGYLQPPDNISPAFFPLYPLLIRSFAELFGGPISQPSLSVWGVLISLLALPFALYFVYRIAEDGWGERVARITVLALAFFPTSFFLNAVYTESLFLALSAGSLWAARVRKDLLLACALAAFATATRNVGVFLIAPLAYEWLKGGVGREYGLWRGAACLALASSGLLWYAAYLWQRFGSPLLFYTEQQRWGREATNPLTALRGTLVKAGEGVGRFFDPGLWEDPSLGRLADHVGAANNAYNLLFLGLALALLLAGLRVLPLSLSAYAFLLILPPAFFGTAQGPLMGLPRYVLVAFPLFIVLGVLLKNRRLLGAWLILSGAASLVLCALFVSWRYVA
ncbi:MAG: glycosyltransferase family 39 protein [Actinobacteria bacterium]|nr:glycosyltransferase family 39 protein [Actinomycetota bacterium]